MITDVPVNTTPLQEKYQHVLGLIIDEYSFLSNRLFGILVQTLLKLRQKQPQNDWPDIKLMLTGDIFQLKPVNEGFLHQSPDDRENKNAKKNKSKKSKSYQYASIGYQFFKQIRNVVYLSVAYRFQKDEEWGVQLNEARVGNWTEPMRKVLQSRVVKYRNINEVTETCPDSVFICPDNETKDKLNKACIEKFASQSADFRRSFAVVLLAFSP